MKKTVMHGDVNAMMFWAFRYAHGRMTYAAQDVADFIAQNKDALDDYTRTLILREIKNHTASMTEIDREVWNKLAAEIAR